MVKPFFIPRTLRGVGGVRLFDLPGVVYPKEMLITKVGLNNKSGKPYSKIPPGWGIPTSCAAKILGITACAARSLLHRRRIPFRIVGENGQPMRIYWRKLSVERLAAIREADAQRRASGRILINAKDAMRIIGVARTSLTRYVRKGILTAHRERCLTTTGLHPCILFDPAEVEKLAAYRRQAEARQRKVLDFRKENRPFSLSKHPRSSTTKQKNKENAQ